MPQLSLKPWKSTIFKFIAQAERTLRGFSAPADLSHIRNFLVLQYESPLGSVVHAIPLFEALKHAVPDAHITVAASGMAASVLGHNPYIDRCVVTPSPTHNFSQAARAVRALVQSMPKGPRCILTTIGNQRTRIALLSLFAGKTVRSGYTLVPELYDVSLTFHPERGQIEGNLDILRRLSHVVPFCEPRIFFTKQDVNYARNILQPTADTPRIAYVTQNSGGQPNRWKEDRFIQIMSELYKIRGAIPIFVGTAADAAAIERLRQSLPDPGISAAGKTSIPQLAALLAQCDLVVSLDTGTFHVARAVEMPGVVIAPAWQSALEWLPVNHPQYRVLQGPRIPAPDPAYSIEEISIQQVIEAALDLMARFSPSQSARAARLERSTIGRAGTVALRQ
jgi:ADP-heptose:LPS heptosyltransferase